mmetsp:Transcript_94986/g.307273  ORF Transcript_94986/g.307273 Transcript_94986/m.307273 type:complete len:239 (+) Transcript_94986:256-972(+)
MLTSGSTSRSLRSATELEGTSNRHKVALPDLCMQACLEICDQLRWMWEILCKRHAACLREGRLQVCGVFDGRLCKASFGPHGSTRGMRLREEGARGRRLLRPPAIRRRLRRADLLRISGDRMPHDVELQRGVDEDEQCCQHDDVIDDCLLVAAVVINEEPDEEEELTHVGGHHHTKQKHHRSGRGSSEDGRQAAEQQSPSKLQGAQGRDHREQPQHAAWSCKGYSHADQSQNQRQQLD